MILLVGQVPRAFRGREAWQELDYAEVFGGIAKAAWEVDSAERIPEHIAEAYSLALTGRPGPVVLALPEDVLAEEADVADGTRVEPERVAPSGADSSGFASSSPAPSALSSSSARAVGRPRRAAMCRRSARRTPFRSRARFAARTSSTTARRATSACSVSRWTRRSLDAFATPTSCSRSAVGWARCRRAATRFSNRRIRGRRSIHVHPDAERARARLRARPRDRRDAHRVRVGVVRSRSGGAALARVDVCSTSRLRGEPPQRADGGRRRPR